MAGLATPLPPEQEDLPSRLPPVLMDALKPYQVEGIRFVIRRGGRGLIGDEMGEWSSEEAGEKGVPDSPESERE